MNQRVSLQLIVPLLIVVVLFAAIGLQVIGRGNPVSIAPLLPARTADQTNVEVFDTAKASELSAARWQAMARFYDENGMLTRDPFDYDQAAELSAYRWEAMARFYEDNGLLNDRMDPGDLSAYRWNAMAREYERLGLLNE